MVRLSGRLEGIYDAIEAGARVADIGTDHGLLPIALWERGRTDRLVMTDARPGPMEKAAENLRRRLPDAERAAFDLRVGDGLAPLAAGEADIVVIAGMGGRLIADILFADEAKARSFPKYLLQPRNAAPILRRRLAERAFRVADERLAREGRFIWEILTIFPPDAATGSVRTAPDAVMREAEAIARAAGLSYEIPMMPVYNRDPLFPEWLTRKTEAERHLLEKLSRAPAPAERLRETRRRLAGMEAIRGVLGYE